MPSAWGLAFLQGSQKSVLLNHLGDEGGLRFSTQLEVCVLQVSMGLIWQKPGCLCHLAPMASPTLPNPVGLVVWQVSEWTESFQTNFRVSPGMWLLE